MLLLYMWSDTCSSSEGVHMQLATMIYMFSICKLWNGLAPHNKVKYKLHVQDSDMNRQELVHLKQLVTNVEFEKSRISDLLHMVQASLNTAELDALVMKQKNYDLTQEIVKLGTLSGEPCTVVNTGFLATDIEVGYESRFRGSKALCNGYYEKLDSTGSYSLLHDESNDHHIGRLISKTVNIGNDAVTIDKGESSIISNILSIDFDPWDDSITSPYNIVKLLSDNTDSQPASNSLRATHSIRVWQKETFIANGFPTSNFKEAENISNAHSIASSNRLSAISRAQVSAPPGTA
ncbi:hypothetical protein KIW84_043207 [Lathyrus oleraceus]|uniref:Uncharacterized protein n=1 Tax=Pisum sativum TaxID=3888 RepID=A0A9D5ATP3_PEA|nr:hypothetical protein KIW84_043207 [Pisum sativum]